MLTGQPAMAETETKDMLAKMLKRSFGAIKPLSEQRYAPDPELCQIVEKMMKVDLKARYQTVDEVLRDLQAYESRHSSSYPTPETEEDELDENAIFVHSFREDPKRKDSAHNGAKAVAVPLKNLLCVETQSEIQDAFRKSLTKMGYRVFLVGDPERAAERYREQPPDAVIFDADGLGPEAVDSFLDMHEKAREDGHELAALVLLGPRQIALKEKFPAEDRLVILSKPIKMKQIQDTIAQLVPLT
jgi:eukaryotic-like serine/threonine-protein kinase